jgi:hypothetical protein
MLGRYCQKWAKGNNRLNTKKRNNLQSPNIFIIKAQKHDAIIKQFLFRVTRSFSFWCPTTTTSGPVLGSGCCIRRGDGSGQFGEFGRQIHAVIGHQRLQL